MTQEQKAKAYDEALKRAKAAIDIAADKDLVKGVATTIFPQLRESEDERIWQWLYDIVDTGSFLIEKPCETEKILAWLEKHKEHVPENEESGTRKEQKPAWSEKDEAMRKSILWVLESYVSKAECEQSPALTATYPTYYKEIDWLKSLRPSWKPTEEQMDALAYAIQILDDGLSPKAAKAGEELEHLREQLKQL